jgi:hypothetical protein
MELSETDPGAQSPNADASGTDVSAALSVDTSETGLEGVASEGANNSSSKVTPKSAATTAAMDNHPYARGAVIEVLHGVKETNAINDGDLSGENVSSSKGKYGNLNIVGFSKEDEDWWNEDSDEY